MKAVTAEQMRQLDAQTIAAGTSVDELMERAGAAVARAVGRWLSIPATPDRPIVVFAGKGNNAGDAFVAARHLAQAGHAVQLVMLSRREELRDAPLRNLRRLHNLKNLELFTWDQAIGPKSKLAARPAVVVDGLLGIGLSGEVREPIASAIRRINELPAPVVAVDVPSGLGTGCCVGAALTVTFGLPKIELLRYPDEVGRIEVVDIGLTGSVESDVEMIAPADVRPSFPPRRRSAHKGDFGHLLIVAGSVGFTGAPVLCAMAAARAGVGLVTLAVPREIYPIVASQCPPEVMPRPLENLDYARFDAIAVGPGIGREVPWLPPLIRDSNRPLVLDADALNFLASDLKLLKSAQAVLTPHPGEMARLIGQPVRDRWEVARAFAKQHNVTLVLKGAHTVVTDPTGVLWVNATGNPGMAKGGMGDALTGILGAFLARGLAPLEAAKAAVYLHGVAGDLAAEALGQEALQTTDLIAQLPAAWQSLARA
ncbi:MAG: NAD(P)H-hydrate dehydratase [Verrucomicrobiae bacterium]|nr:NAD(P)H-hydrate dehydratase [Verrucomicrobiae bacterium]